MTKIAGSGSESESGSISQRHGSADPNPDPDPPQNVMDPQHCSRDARNVGKTSRKNRKAATVETLAIAGTNQQQG
jgi:hypothetical protein